MARIQFYDGIIFLKENENDNTLSFYVQYMHVCL